MLEIEQWFQQAGPGDKFCYRRGPIHIKKVMDAAYNLAASGVAELVQRKISSHLFEYWIIKRKEKNKNPPFPKYFNARFPMKESTIWSAEKKSEHDNAVFDIINEAAEKHDFAPLNKEMSEKTGITKHGISKAIKRLVENGRVVILWRGSRRRFRIAETGKETREAWYRGCKS